MGRPLPHAVRGRELPRCRSTEQAPPFSSGPRDAWVLLTGLIGAPKTRIGGAGVSARQIYNWPRIGASVRCSGFYSVERTLDPFDPGSSLRRFAQVFPVEASTVLPGLRSNPTGFPHAGATVASRRPSIYQPAQHAFSAAFMPFALGCEYLRGVSVVQGLPPRPVQLAVWGFAFTLLRGYSFLIGFSPTPDGLSLPSMLEALRWLPVCQHAQLIFIAAPQSHAFGCEYLRGVSVVQGLPPQPMHPARHLPFMSEVLCAGEAVGLLLLRLIAAYLVPLARSLLALAFLTLLRTLARPWRTSTPLGRAYCFPLSGVRPHILQPLGGIARTAPVLEWLPWSGHKCRTGRSRRRGRTRQRATSWFWLLLLRCLSVPGRTAPGAVSGVGAAWVYAACVPVAHGAEAPDDLPTAEPVEDRFPPDNTHGPRRIPDPVLDGSVAPVPDYIGVSDAPRGPPPPHPVRITVDNAVRHTRPVQFQECNFSVWVGTPYHVPETLQFPLRLPCDIEDALDATERHVQSLKLDYCDRAIAVRPQPFASCAAVILAPDWSTYSALSVVCLDLRDLGENADGPVIVSFVTRPTCLAELCREASVHDTSHCRVYLGTDTAPMQPDEEVHLASGCLVTFMRTDRLPCFSNDLQFRLQFPSVWTQPPRFPASPAIRSSLLLLHSSGRYLYRPQASHDPGDIAAARFVGVNRAEVDFHTPRPGSIERVMYRGIRVRGVIAIADRLYEEQFVVFLDLRQVAEAIQFELFLATPLLPLTALPNLLHTQPPPGWVLQVTGGRRRRDRIDICEW